MKTTSAPPTQRSRSPLPALLLAFFVGLLSGPVARAAAFTNGSFELPGVSPSASVLELSAGNTNLVGWTIGGTGGPLYVYYSGTAAADGTNALHFNVLNQPSGTWIAQSFDTIIGATYDVSYFVGRGSAGEGIVSLTASVRSQGATLLAQATSSPVSQGYGTVQHLVFTATTSTSTLEFLDTSLATVDVDLLLDNVVLTELDHFALPAGCAAWWPGDGNAMDIQGKNHGTAMNGVAFATGKQGQAFSFDGVDDEIVVPLTMDLQPQELTMLGWIKATAFNTPFHPVIAKQGSGNGHASYALGIDSQGRPRVSFYNGNGETILHSPSPIETHRWYHLAGVRSGSNIALYVDGQQVTNAPFGTRIDYDNVSAVQIGTYLRWEPAAGFRFSGLIDEVGLFNRALTSQEIRFLWSPLLITNQPQLFLGLPGGSATFFVGVQGQPPLYYQWWFNATNLLAGQTNSTLIISNVQPANVGLYSVVVSNAVGSVTSSNAFLTIVRPGLDDDGDGLVNEQEILFGTSFLNPDTDGDGLSDYEELCVHGTSPLLADTDGDGIPDGWEVQHGLNPRFNDAPEDLDGDGLSNLAEYNWGLSQPNQPFDPRTPYSTSLTVSDYALATGSRTNWFLYDRNDRLIGAQYDSGLALAYLYDGNDNLARQKAMRYDANTNGLPDLWEFLNGLTTTSAFDDTDGDGWTDAQEWKAGTSPTNVLSTPNLLGNPGINIASLMLPFTPSNFVVGVGQLDGAGTEEVVLGADGNPGTNTNFLLVLTQGVATWQTQRVDIGPFGITSIAVGQPTNRPSAGIYVGMRGTTNGSGRVMEFTRAGGVWQSNVVALSTNQAAFVLGVQGNALLASFASTNGTSGSLSSLFAGSNSWTTSTLSTNISSRGLGTLATLNAGFASSLRLLDSGGIEFTSRLNRGLVAYWSFDESCGNAQDSVSTNTLANTGSIPYGPGKINNGVVSTHDPTRYLSVADNGQFSITGDISISCWVKFNTMPSDRYEFISKPFAGAEYGPYHFELNRNGAQNELRGLTRIGANFQTVAYAWNPLTGVWYNVVYTRVSSTGVQTLYVNGFQVRQATNQVGAALSDATPLYVTLFCPSCGTGGLSLDGILDELGLWNVALTPDQVSSMYASMIAATVLAEPLAVRSNNWCGTSLASGFLRGTNGSSIFYTFADDKNANGLIDFADEFVTAEYLVNGTNVSLLTTNRQPLAALTPAQSYGLASVNFLNASNEVFFTGEPDGQVFAWTATGAASPLQRQLFSGHHAGKAWHALAGVKTLELGESLLGLRVDPASPNNCDVILWSPQSQLPQLASLPNSAPAAVVLPSTNALGAQATLTVRLWDAEGNASTPYLQFQLGNSTNWHDATLATLDGTVYSPSTRVAAHPGGVNHTLVWDALANVSAGVVTNVSLRARASDMTLLGDWSTPTPFQLNTTLADNDTLPDWWELQFFGTTARTGLDDFDLDGFTDLAEYRADTNPTNAASRLEITGISFVPTGLKVDWQGGILATQELQRSIGLSATNSWSNIFTALPPTPASGSYTDSVSTNVMQFYRIRATR